MAMNMNDSFQERVELTRLLAKFKLNVRRQLNQSVNLERLQNEPDYAREQLAALEEQIDDEELLVTLLVLRDRLVPKPADDPVPEIAKPVGPTAEPAPSRYRLGPRS
jgi:hypothetical protein